MRIIIGAQSFGFGPVSKAVAIATSIRKRHPEVDLVFCADRLSREYLATERLWQDGRDVPSDGLGRLDVLGVVDAALGVLDPELIAAFHTRVPTYFVDSLGFMWEQDFFLRYPAVRNATRYFVQDVFGAAERLRTMGITNLHPVGAIVDTRVPAGGVQVPAGCVEADLVVNLGGLLNIFSDEPVRNYVDGIMTIVARLAENRSALVLTSRRARQRFATLLNSPIPVQSLPHGHALAAFSHARTLLTSPGLTTLLELVEQGIPFIPLPPQNLSQALIVANIAKRLEGAPPIWAFLCSNYPVSPGMDEEASVRMVQERNAAYLSDAVFLADYLALVRGNAPTTLPRTIVSDFDGADTICATMIGDLAPRVAWH